MVRYFDHYVQRQNIALMLGCEVHRVDRAGGVWQLATSSGEIRTPAIVLVTGNYSAPTIPAWPGLNRFNGETAAGRGRCAAREPNRHCNRFTSKEVNAVPMPTSSASVETELMKTRYDAHVFTVAAT